jgi:Acetyltransferase (GNAT) domain
MPKVGTHPGRATTQIAPAQPPALRLEVHTDEVPTGWDRWVRDLDGGPFQCAGWARFRTAAGRKQPLFFTWHKPGSPGPVAVALGIAIALPGPLRTRSIQFDAPPATRLDPRRLVPDIERWMKSQRGVADAALGSFDTDQAWSDAPEQPTRIEFHVTPGSEEQLFARMRTLARRSIRRAERRGINIDTDSARLREFVDLYAVTLDRLRRAKGVATALADPDGFAQQLAALRAAGIAKLFLATADGIPVAGVLFTAFAGRAFYLSGGSSDLGRETGATAALIYRAACEFSAAGFTRINLGGVPGDGHLPSSRDHGLYAFKLGMGGMPHPCWDTRIVVRPMLRRCLDLARTIRWTLLRLGASLPG